MTGNIDSIAMLVTTESQAFLRTFEIRYRNKRFEIVVSKIFRVFKVRSPASLRNFRDNENFSNYGTTVVRIQTKINCYYRDLSYGTIVIDI